MRVKNTTHVTLLQLTSTDFQTFYTFHVAFLIIHEVLFSSDITELTDENT